jgi:hypothetical protein
MTPNIIIFVIVLWVFVIGPGLCIFEYRKDYDVTIGTIVGVILFGWFVGVVVLGNMLMESKTIEKFFNIVIIRKRD